MKSIARLALMSTVSTAAAICFLPGSASAQATSCSQTGDTITCVDGTTTVLTATASAGTVTVPGPGLVTLNAVAPSTTTYTADGAIGTTGMAGVRLTSTAGPLSFTPAGTTQPVPISTTGGVGANGLTINTAGQAATVTVGNISTSGATSPGVSVVGGTDLTLRTGDVTTTGAGSRGINAINQTGTINITAGNITTTDRAISANTAVTANTTIVAGNISTGASGILGNGNNVTITTGNVTTTNGFGVIGQALVGTTGGITIRTGTVSTVNGAGIGGLVQNLVGGVDIGGCSNVTSVSPINAAVYAQN
ncbi:MAG TPA: hypothetical protein VGB48_03275, partial [Allosphingosinicella sp.]